MRKIFLTLAIIFAGTMWVIGQTNNNQNNQSQNKAPQMIQPDMQKDTVPLFLGHCAGPVKASDIAKGDSLFMNKVGFQIVGFALVYRKDTSLVKFEAKNCKLTTEMKSALKELKPGQNFAFVNVRIMAKDGVIRKPTYGQIDMFIEKEK